MEMEELDQCITCQSCSTSYPPRTGQKPGECIPHLLLCGHSICMADAKRLIEENDLKFLPCQVCERKINIAVYHNKFPPENLILRNQLFELKSIKKETEKSSDCEECQQRPPSIYCKDCKFELCDDCNTSNHQARAFQNHKRISLGEKASIPPESYCSIHKDRILEFICLESKCRSKSTVICSLCHAIGSHKGHDVSLIEAIVSSEKMKCTEILLSVSSNRKSLQGLVDQLSFAEQTFASNRDNYINAVKADFTIIHEAVDRLENQVIDFINDEMNDFGFSNLQIQIASEINELLIMEYKSKLILKENDATILAKLSELTSTLQMKLKKMEEYLSGFTIPLVDFIYEKKTMIPSVEKNDIITNREIGALGNEILNYLSSFPFTKYLQLINDVNRFNTLDLTLKDVSNELVITGKQELDGSPGNLRKFASLIIKKGGILTVKGYNGKDGTGVLHLIVNKLIIEEGGEINLNGCGYRGGNGAFGKGKDGEYCSTIPGFVGGGGAGSCIATKRSSTCGAGGGLGTRGCDTEPEFCDDTFKTSPGGIGGAALTNNLKFKYSKILLGSGGGGGSGDEFGAKLASQKLGSREFHPAPGGNGGGLIIIQANEIINNGLITADGLSGATDSYNLGCYSYDSRGGGGSGGSIHIMAKTFQNINGKVSAMGGGYHTCRGGDGLIFIDVLNEIKGIENISPVPNIHHGKIKY